MLKFIRVFSPVFVFLSPMVLVGKWLDFHLQREGQVRAKGFIEYTYLHASYGTLLLEYAKKVTEIAKNPTGRMVSFSALIVFILAIATCAILNSFLVSAIFILVLSARPMQKQQRRPLPMHISNRVDKVEARISSKSVR